MDNRVFWREKFPLDGHGRSPSLVLTNVGRGSRPCAFSCLEIQLSQRNDLAREACYRSFYGYRCILQEYAHSASVASNANDGQKRNLLGLIVVTTALILLSFERIVYVLVSRRPELFGALCRSSIGHYLCNEPTRALRRLFYVFKALQLSVFTGWCYYFGHDSFVAVQAGPVALVLGATALITGQILNWAVFYRLGTLGVFYGNRFGHQIPRDGSFPFSLFNHPQYVGTVTSIWGFFIISRFPCSDWYLLPMVETLYYGVGAWLEE